MNDQNQKPKIDDLTGHWGFGFGVSFGFRVSGFGFLRKTGHRNCPASLPPRCHTGSPPATSNHFGRNRPPKPAQAPSGNAPNHLSYSHLHRSPHSFIFPIPGTSVVISSPGQSAEVLMVQTDIAHRLTALLADENQDWALTVRGLLAPQGVQTVAARTGREAL